MERAAHGSSWLESAVQGPLQLVQHHAWEELQDPTRREILIFLVAILAMVGVVSAAGGLQGLARSLARVAGNARRSQCASFGLGLVVFFDHCANAMLVGTTMRPLTDRFRVSREKLAYLVDSTAAPVAGLSVFSTWIAFEVSAFSPQLRSRNGGIPGLWGLPADAALPLLQPVHPRARRARGFQRP